MKTLKRIIKIALLLALSNSVCWQSNAQPSPGTLKWAFPALSWVYSSAAIGTNGTVYFTDITNLYAINPTNGTEEWAFPIDNSGITNSTGPAIFSSPVVGRNGTIYVGDEGGHFYAIDPNGSLKWVYPSAGSPVALDAIISTPAIGPDETIYVGATGATYEGSEISGFFAFASDGSLRPGFPGSLYLGSPGASPAIGRDGTIYMLQYPLGELLAARSDGLIFWEVPMDCTGGCMGYTLCSPSIGPDGSIYDFGCTWNDFKLYAFNSNPYLFATQGTNWVSSIFDPSTGNPYDVASGPVIAANGTNIYYGMNSAVLYQSDSATGTIVAGRQLQPSDASCEQYGITASPAVAADGNVYVQTCSTWESYYLGTNNGILYLLPSTLTTSNWDVPFATFPAPGMFGGPGPSEYAVSPSPTIGPDGTVYLGSSDGHLYAYNGTVGASTNSVWSMWGANSAQTRCAARPITLINVQMVISGAPFETNTGIAAEGIWTNDYWNAMEIKGKDGPSGPISATIDNLLDSAKNSTSIVLTESGGDTGRITGSTVKLLNQAVENPSGEDILLTLTNLPAGSYDFYLYGAGGTNGASMLNSSFSITSGATNAYSPASQATATNNYDMNGLWVENTQYVVFWAVQSEGTNVPLVIDASGWGSAFVNGLQIVRHN